MLVEGINMENFSLGVWAFKCFSNKANSVLIGFSSIALPCIKGAGNTAGQKLEAWAGSRVLDNSQCRCRPLDTEPESAGD